jgi:hypothetical protein
MYVEATLELVLASIWLAALPSRWILSPFGDPVLEPDAVTESGLMTATPPASSPATVSAARVGAQVGRTVEVVAARLPWHPSCLRQALAAARMLRRRGVPAQVQLGVDGAKLTAAHAWVSVGERVVVGRNGRREVTQVAQFVLSRRTPKIRESSKTPGAAR